MAERSISVQGSANQSIIISGDHNQVGGSVEFRIPLVRYHAPARRRRGRQTPASVLDILSAHNKALSLQGRERELTLLNEWLSDDADISVFAITAPAGSGKTRLAIELCEQIELQTGWAAGFIRSDDLAELARAFKFGHANWSHSLLLVVDYASANAQALAQWLDALSQLDELTDGIRVRILLLEREACKEAGWWHTLTGSALDSDQTRLDLFTQFEPYVLAGLGDITVRRAVLCAALNAAQALVPHPNVSKVPEADEQPDFDSDLADPQFGNPLALVMAGILCRDMLPRAALSLHYLAAAEKLAQREIDRFNKCFGEGAETTKLAHCLCFHLLSGGLRVADIRQTLSAELIAMGWHTPSLDKELLALQLAFPPADDGGESIRLPTTQPDLIAEAMCIKLLQSDRERSLKAPGILARTLEYGQEQAVAALVRLLQDFACPVSQPSSQQAQLLQWAERLVEDNLHKPALLALLNNAMPLSSVALAELACKLATILYQQSLAQTEQQVNEASRARLARSLHNLANRQSKLGQREAALTSGLEAVDHYRSLSLARSNAFLPGLAVSLNNLANQQSALGQHDAALSSVLEAVELLRVLAQAHPDAFLANLAISLNSLAGCQSNLGQHEAADSAAQEAVEHYRLLVKEYPDDFLPDLAMSLNNMAIFQSKLGQYEVALSAAQEAVEYFRMLAQASPDAFLPNLAMSLNNLANQQSYLGQREAACTSALETVDHYRLLVQAHPDAFLPELAKSLNNLAKLQSDLGQREAAHAAVHEAVERYRALAQAYPDAFLPDLGMSLSNLASLQSDLGQREAAMTTALEAVVLRRKLAQARPDAFLPDLATSLSTLANRQSELGLREVALTTALEAVELRRKLAQARPDAFLLNLAESLNNLAILQSDLGQREAAHTTALEAVALRRKLAQARPDVFLPELAGSLNTFATLQSDLGQHEAALITAKEAVDYFRALAKTRPDAFLSDLAGSLNNLAIMQSDLGQREAAHTAALEAVELRRKLAQVRPGVFLSDLADSLNNLASRQSELGQYEAAVATSQEVVQRLSPYFIKWPDTYEARMKRVLSNYLYYCETAAQLPDIELIHPIIETFNELEQE